MLLQKITNIISWPLIFIINSYRKHWLATPAAALSGLVSTFGTATLMYIFSPFYKVFLTNIGYTHLNVILINAVLAPLLAYFIYLTTYYSCMFFKEYKELKNSIGKIDKTKLKKWLRVVKYDYLAHLPSDCYLIPIAGTIQAGLEGGNMPIFWAVVLSQSADDIITFLKEPALWNGAKEIVTWETKNKTTLPKHLLSTLTKKIKPTPSQSTAE